MGFELFDPKAEYVIREGALPHWFQPGVTYFVTFRTADSVPQELARSWHLRRATWLRKNGIDPNLPNWKVTLDAKPSLAIEFHDKFDIEFFNWLDQGLGECVLARPELSAIVADSLRSGDDERYHLGDFVVMPNHVHILIGLIGATSIEDQCYSWKKFTATKINRLLGRKGRFWQEESFDHLVRSQDHFEYFQRYIADNPKKAGLMAGSYIYHRLKASER